MVYILASKYYNLYNGLDVLGIISIIDGWTKQFISYLKLEFIAYKNFFMKNVFLNVIKYIHF